MNHFKSLSKIFAQFFSEIFCRNHCWDRPGESRTQADGDNDFLMSCDPLAGDDHWGRGEVEGEEGRGRHGTPVWWWELENKTIVWITLTTLWCIFEEQSLLCSKQDSFQKHNNVETPCLNGKSKSAISFSHSFRKKTSQNFLGLDHKFLLTNRKVEAIRF